MRTVSKLREAEEQGTARTIGRVTNLPVDRLRRALERASSPLVEHVTPVQLPGKEGNDLANLVRIRGRNLVRDGLPRVTVAGEPVGVVRASDSEIVIAPQQHQMHGKLTVEHAPELASSMAFDLRPFWRDPAEGPNGGVS